MVRAELLISMLYGRLYRGHRWSIRVVAVRPRIPLLARLEPDDERRGRLACMYWCYRTILSLLGSLTRAQKRHDASPVPLRRAYRTEPPPRLTHMYVDPQTQIFDVRDTAYTHRTP